MRCLSRPILQDHVFLLAYLTVAWPLGCIANMMVQFVW